MQIHIIISKERIVKLGREAFFELAKDKNGPFWVEVNGQQIEVLGTSFNVIAYDNSNEIETRLKQVRSACLPALKLSCSTPGEQSVLTRNTNCIQIGSSKNKKQFKL